jgi:predicted AlkP superfamily pyrophosphatase or phosphodiesterase
MRARHVAALAASITTLGCGRQSSSTSSPAPQATRPTLVVMMVIDQLRKPLLDRYDDLFTGGFRRLLDDGYFFVNASHDHAVTKTAPGHATLATGRYPSRHGIVANEWDEKTAAGWLQVSNVGDSTVRIVGQPRRAGVSPHYLMVSGVAEWLLAANPRSQVASISPKDRGAVLPAARAKGQVYWFDIRAGRFVTSTYYRDAYPEWVDRFNAEVVPRYRDSTEWVSTIPAHALGRSTPDTASYENDGRNTFFPHRYSIEKRGDNYWDWFERVPMLDQLSLEMARTTITALGLGRDDAPDFLNISLSQTDRVGHDYGPLSREELDNLLRLDRALAEFFAFLDATVGAGRWALGLSADHGSLLTPELLPTPEENITARRQTRADVAAMNAIRAEADRNVNDPATPPRVVAAVKQLPFVADAWTHEDLRRQPAADSFAVLFQRALYPGRQGEEFDRQGVSVRFVPGFMDRDRGSGHGLPYWYDRHVPIIFMGPGITRGRDASRTSTVDFAPTLAGLLGIPVPSGLDGRPLRLR